MSFRPWLVGVLCACGAPLVPEGEATYTFRSVEAVDDTRLAACPDALVDGLADGATLAREEVGAEQGTLGLLGEAVPVRFHPGDENDAAGVFPVDFAAVHRVGEVGWFLVEAEQVRGGLSIVVEAEDGRCVVLARYDED